MCLGHVEITSTTGDGKASEQRSSIPSYHTTVVAVMNREGRAKRGAACEPRYGTVPYHYSSLYCYRLHTVPGMMYHY